jgi:hypothetical protein
MTSVEFAAYAGPVLILAAQQLNHLISARRAAMTQRRLSEIQTAAGATANAVAAAREDAAREVKAAMEATARDVKAAARITALEVAQGKASTDVKLDNIHVLVNGNLEAAKSHIALLILEVSALRDEISVLTAEGLRLRARADVQE